MNRPSRITPALAAEIRQYMESYNVDYATAARDVLDEYNQAPTETDAFMDNVAHFEGYDAEGLAVYSNVVLG